MASRRMARDPLPRAAKKMAFRNKETADTLMAGCSEPHEQGRLTMEQATVTTGPAGSSAADVEVTGANADSQDRPRSKIVRLPVVLPSEIGGTVLTSTLPGFT